METLTVTKWNLADEIETKDDVAGILEAALEENDVEFLFKVIGDIARSKGMAQIARELGLNRESLHIAFSPEGNSSFTTVLKVLNVLGFQLSIQPKKAS